MTTPRHLTRSPNRSAPLSLFRPIPEGSSRTVNTSDLKCSTPSVNSPTGATGHKDLLPRPPVVDQGCSSATAPGDATPWLREPQLLAQGCHVCSPALSSSRMFKRVLSGQQSEKVRQLIEHAIRWVRRRAGRLRRCHKHVYSERCKRGRAKRKWNLVR